jgi:formaldehyde-activating enzyme involved in methanogenesis
MPLNLHLSGHGGLTRQSGRHQLSAAREAIAHAIKGEPKASEVAAKKDLAHHPLAAD